MSRSYTCSMCSAYVELSVNPSKYASSCRAKELCEECNNNITISKIDEGLFLSNYTASRQYKRLKKLGIEQILTVASGLPKHSHSDFKYMRINIEDEIGANMRQHLDAAHEFISAAPTLAHCIAGVSRSPTVVISYLMKMRNLPLHDALNVTTTARPIVALNVGFMDQLRRYEEELNQQRNAIQQKKQSNNKQQQK